MTSMVALGPQKALKGGFLTSLPLVPASIKTIRRSATGVCYSFTTGHSPRSSGQKPSPFAGQRKRVAAVAIDAPSGVKEDEEQKQRLSENQARLTKMYFAAPFLEKDVEPTAVAAPEQPCPALETISIEDDEAVVTLLQRQRDSRATSTSTADCPTGVVPSTRHRRGRRPVKASRPTPKTMLTTGLDRFGDLANAYLAANGGSDPDLDYLNEMRAGLQAGRKSKRSRAGAVGTTNVIVFLNNLGHTSILSNKQEAMLGSIIQKGRAVKAAAKELAASLERAPDMEEVAELAGMSCAGEAALRLALAEEATELMVQFNLRMVFSMAKRYVGKGVDLADLIPEGIVGLRRAIDKFDASKGFRFSTYGHWWIRQAVSRSVSSHGRVVRIPLHVVEFLSKVKRVRRELESQPGRTKPPTKAELAAALGVTVSKLVYLQRLAREPRNPDDTLGTSLNALKDGASAAGAGNGATMDDLWAEEYELGADPVAETEREEFLRQTLNLMLSTLPKRDRNVLRMRYGLFPAAVAQAAETEAVDGPDADEPGINYYGGMNLQEVGTTYGLSRERIRQIEDRAMSALRHPWRVSLLQRIRDGGVLDEDVTDELERATAAAQHPWS